MLPPYLPCTPNLVAGTFLGPSTIGGPGNSCHGMVFQSSMETISPIQSFLEAGSKLLYQRRIRFGNVFRLLDVGRVIV